MPGNTRFFRYQSTLKTSYHSTISVILHSFLKMILLTFPQLMSLPLQRFLVHTYDIVMEYNDINEIYLSMSSDSYLMNEVSSFYLKIH